MLKLEAKDLETMTMILGKMYVENGNTEEVVLLSEAIDRIIVSIQKDLYIEYKHTKNT